MQPPTAASLDAYLSKRGSPLAGHGAAFVAAGHRYGFDPRLLVAISGAESSFGVHSQGHNPFGWGPGIKFGSWQQAIDRVGRGLKELYISQGLTTPTQIQGKWAPVHAKNDPTGLNSNWLRNVQRFMGELGGPSGGQSRRPASSGSPTSPTLTAAPDLSSLALTGLQETGTGRRHNAVQGLTDLATAVRSAPAVQPAAGQPAAPAPVSAGGPVGKVILPRGADRPGVRTSEAILAFTRQVAGLAGRTLKVGTGTNHNEFVAGTNRESEHWRGNAVDVPASGMELIRLGRLALIAAGMPRKQAMKAKGGIYNVGNHQVIYASKGHFDHLHISSH